MTIFKNYGFIAAALLVLSGCSSTPTTFGAAAGVQVTDLEQLPAKPNAGFYQIGPQEILEITVVGSELLSSKFITDEQGQIDFPLAGRIDLSNQSPAGASRAIASRLRGEYVLDPQVIVIPEGLDEITFSVGGQVDKPGDYPIDENMTLLRAVNTAGGLGEYAKLEETLVFREVGGQRYIGVYNLEAIQQGNYPDPQLYANDVVMVGDSASKRRLETILQFVPVLSTAVILIDRIGRR
jgi:polysaccharide export outer membrane protein